jgi:hypothetical protein
MTIRHSFNTILAALCLFCVAGTAQAQYNPLITVDQNGNGTIDFGAVGGVEFALFGVLAPDPGPGGLPSALTYELGGPPALIAGDLLLYNGFGELHDVIRFNPEDPATGYQASLLFYSITTGIPVDLADTLVPPGAFYPNTASMVEGYNGAVYTPGPNDPGFVPGFDVTYHIITDVPEPGAVAFFAGIGLSGAAILHRKRIHC